MILCEHQIWVKWKYSKLRGDGHLAFKPRSVFFFFDDFQFHISKQDGEFFREGRVYNFDNDVAYFGLHCRFCYDCILCLLFVYCNSDFVDN